MAMRLGDYHPVPIRQAPPAEMGPSFQTVDAAEVILRRRPGNGMWRQGQGQRLTFIARRVMNIYLLTGSVKRRIECDRGMLGGICGLNRHALPLSVTRFQPQLLLNALLV
jgi:hypothetical protein